MNAVKNAELRAFFISRLRQRPGHKESVTDLAAAAEVSPQYAAEVLKNMANNGLIGEVEGWYVYRASGVRRASAGSRANLLEDDVLAILGLIAAFKKGGISEDALLSAIRSIISRAKE